MLTLDEKQKTLPYFRSPISLVSGGKSYEGNGAEQYGGKRLVTITNSWVVTMVEKK